MLLVLLGGTTAGVAAAAIRWRTGATIVPRSQPISVAHSPALATATDSALDDAEDATITNDPFRLANEPASVRYEAADAGGAPTPATVVVRPVLVLKAIMGGPPWQAVIDGIPGQPPGTVASPGMRFDKLLVRSVWRDSVVVQGPDTTWTLTFRGRM
jgi:hypothetical protein